ncbi:MAG: (Fe-S)-binding protein [Deltaproteobacteria bacterium]|nr:(Fe-S)-binding protein [Deltaproteobacteria bacterium]
MRGCTQCGECLNVCPVFRRHRREEFSPKAKRLLLEPVNAGIETEGFTWDDVFALARLCAGCGRCKKACARKLSTADLLADVRAGHPHWSQRLWEMWIKHMGPLWPTVGFLAGLAPKGLTPKMLESSLATAKALVNPKNIRPWVRLARDGAPEDDTPVVLFSGCTARNVRPRWTRKAEALLRAAGYALLGADSFTCCGGTMHHAGQYAAMTAMRQANVEAWRALGKPRIAVFCASCHHGLADYADGFLEGAEAETWRRSLTPLSGLLGRMRAEPPAAGPAAYGYHQPCHWDADDDMPLLSRIMPGLVKGSGICCGMGGILKMTDPDLSASMAEACLREMPANVAHILTGCSGCAMQLAAYAREGVTVLHWLDVVEVDRG